MDYIKLAAAQAIENKIAPVLKELKTQNAEEQLASGEKKVDITVGGIPVGKSTITGGKEVIVIDPHHIEAAYEWLDAHGLIKKIPADHWSAEMAIVNDSIVYAPTGEVIEWAKVDTKPASVRVTGCDFETVEKAVRLALPVRDILKAIADNTAADFEDGLPFEE